MIHKNKIIFGKPKKLAMVFETILWTLKNEYQAKFQIDYVLYCNFEW